MRFHLTTEQAAIQDSLRSAISGSFPKERLLALLDEESDFDRTSWDTVMGLGLAGLILPVEAGGGGLGLMECALALETLGSAAAAGPFIGQLLAGMALAKTANAQARDEWLKGVIDGSSVAAAAIGAEWLPDTWDVDYLDGTLSGSVPFVQGASTARLLIVGTRSAGLALAVVGRGVSITPVKSTDRTRRLASVKFEHAPAVELFVPGDPEVHRLFDAALVMVAADALGGAERCLDQSVGYAKEREQFGQPIGRFQALKHQLATMALEVEPARALVWYAAYAQDARLPDAARAASVAKAHVCDRYVSVTRAAIAAHGGIGYTWEYGLNVWFRRAIFDRAYLGSPGVHRARAADLGGW